MATKFMSLFGNSKHLSVYSYLQIINRCKNRCVHTVSTQELPDYRELLKRFIPRSYQFQNIALCKERGKDQPVILTDEWPNFSCTAVFQPWTSTLCFPTKNQRRSRLMLLSSCEEKFGVFLKDSQLLQEGAMIAAIDSVTNGHLDNVAKTMFSEWQITSHYPYKLYYYLSVPEDNPLKLNSDQFFFNKLKPEHAEFIGEYWTGGIEGSRDITKRYLRHLLTIYDISAGIFCKSDPVNPVSWAMYGEMGHAFCMYTLPEYRRKQLALSANINLFVQLEQVGIVPVGEQRTSVFASHETFGKIEKYISGSTCRDSITGECYW